MKDASDVSDRNSPSPDHEQYFLVQDERHRAALEKLPLKGRWVLEIGVGQGALTKLLLERGAKVLGYEIEPGLCRLAHENLVLVEGDVRERSNIVHDPNANVRSSDWAFISNPPYQLLPWIQENVVNIIHDALILIPELARSDFPDFEVVDQLTGEMFSPLSSAIHFLIQRGFDDGRPESVKGGGIPDPGADCSRNRPSSPIRNRAGRTTGGSAMSGASRRCVAAAGTGAPCPRSPSTGPVRS